MIRTGLPHVVIFQWWVLALGIGFATLFSVLGGLLPAYKASKLEPAAALAAT